MYCTNDNFKGINIAGLKLCLAVRIERLIDNSFFQKVIIAHNHNIRLISTNALACKKCMISELTDYSQNGNIVMKWFWFSFCNFNHYLFILSSIFFSISYRYCSPTYSQDFTRSERKENRFKENCMSLKWRTSKLIHLLQPQLLQQSLRCLLKHF